MLLSARQNKIYQMQDLLLTNLRKIKSFPYVLSGGTALSRFYLHHRFSEDLDFFSEEMDYSFKRVERIMTGLRKQGWVCQLVGRTDLPHRLKVTSYLVQGLSELKVDFLEDPFTGMWEACEKETASGILFKVDALDQIYYRKLFSLVEQWHRSGQVARIKDLVDLYGLHSHYRSLEQMMAYLRKHQVPVDEEKIILILTHFKKKDLQTGLRYLKCPWKANEIYQALKKAAEKIFKEGMDV